MKTAIAAAAFALATAHVASAALPPLYEEQVARQEEKLILTSPIAGIENKYWFDYRINVVEAQKELSGDLNHASDIEDRRDAWEEYGHELHKERTHYVKKMAKKGYYRTGTVIVGGEQ